MRAHWNFTTCVTQHNLYQASDSGSFYLARIFRSSVFDNIDHHIFISHLHGHRGFYRDFGPVSWFSAIAVILRRDRENHRIVLCVISAFQCSRKPYCGRETTVCRFISWPTFVGTVTTLSWVLYLPVSDSSDNLTISHSQPITCQSTWQLITE